MEGKRRKKLLNYGWSAARVIDGAVQHLSAVRKVRPASLARPGNDTVNAPKQCYEYIQSRPDYDAAFVDRVLGDPECITEADWLAFMYFRRSLADALIEEPWEPEDRLDDAKEVEFVKVSIAAIGSGVEERTLRRWIDQGMPHRRSGSVQYVQITVVERWTKMKFRHKINKMRRNLTNQRL